MKVQEPHKIKADLAILCSTYEVRIYLQVTMDCHDMNPHL